MAQRKGLAVKLLVVIVNYKVTEFTIDCLRSLHDEIRVLPASHVAVCENGTGPEAVDRLHEVIEGEGWGDWVSLTAVHLNRGFTGGNNLILRQALKLPNPPQYFLLLNADTIVGSRSLQALVDFMDSHPDIGIAGSWLEYADGSPQPNAFRFFSPASEFARALRLGFISRLLRRWDTTPPLPSAASPTGWVSGASMIIRRDVFASIGLLDEALYTYFDDIDLCIRAARAGWPTWYVPESRVVHYDGQSTGVSTRQTCPKRRPPYWFEARRYFFLKNYGPIYTALCDAARIAGFALWRLRRWIQQKPDTDPPRLLADSIRHSVFRTGFRLRPVQNPVLAGTDSAPRAQSI